MGLTKTTSVLQAVMKLYDKILQRILMVQMMKNTRRFTLAWLLGVFFVLTGDYHSYAQTYNDLLTAKLPKTDQYKLKKAQTFNAKAAALMDKVANAPANDTAKGIDNYNYPARINASFCFKNANGLQYVVYDKNIKAFWAANPAKKQSLAPLLNLENAMYDSLTKADGVRGKAEQEIYIDDKIPLLTRAEAIESAALFSLGKILYIYLCQPDNHNLAWVLSRDMALPALPVADTAKLAVVPAVAPDTSARLPVRNATKIYSLLHISDEQKGNFDEFLKNKYARNDDPKSIDFEKLYNTVIDTLHKQWLGYTGFVKLAPDISKTKQTNPGISPVAAGEPLRPAPASTVASLAGVVASLPTDSFYRIQIAACREKLSPRQLKNHYRGDEQIKEVFIDHWFKYSIGAYKTYVDAHLAKDKLHVKGAFVTRYPVSEP
jgi:hypothetical protein